VSFAAITFRVSCRVFVVSVYFVIDSVRKLLDTPSYDSSQRVTAAFSLGVEKMKRGGDPFPSGSEVNSK
jgi:hypothetical protein